MEITLIFWMDRLPQLLITPVGALQRLAFTATEDDWKMLHEPALTHTRSHARQLCLLTISYAWIWVLRSRRD